MERPIGSCTRTPRLHPDLEPTSPAQGPSSIRGPPQRAPAAPLPRPSRTPQATARNQCRSRQPSGYDSEAGPTASSTNTPSPHDAVWGFRHPQVESELSASPAGWDSVFSHRRRRIRHSVPPVIDPNSHGDPECTPRTSRESTAPYGANVSIGVSRVQDGKNTACVTPSSARTPPYISLKTTVAQPSGATSPSPAVEIAPTPSHRGNQRLARPAAWAPDRATSRRTKRSRRRSSVSQQRRVP